MFIPIGGNNLAKRVFRLIVGLVLFGAGTGLMLQSGLGVAPWDVLHQGLAVRFGLTIGIWAIIVSFIVLLFWIPLKERYGIGTILNALIIGAMIDLTAAVVPAAENTVVAMLMLGTGILSIGFASGLYIGANLGPGPRDGLMTGISRRGPSIRLVRSIIEIVVLTTGWLLGGTFGIGTIAFALLIGPLVQFSLARLTIDSGRTEDSWDHPAR
ncbi:MAG: YitT family protein [Acidimicrobiia bacterium]